MTQLEKDVTKVKEIKEGTIVSKPTHFVSNLQVYRNNAINRFRCRTQYFTGTKEDCEAYLRIILTKAV